MTWGSYGGCGITARARPWAVGCCGPCLRRCLELPGHALADLLEALASPCLALLSQGLRLRQELLSEVLELCL